MQHHQYFNKLLKVKSLAENTLKLLLNDKENIILVAVSIGTKNWGDALNLPLVHQISGKIPVVAYRSKFNFFNPSPDQQPVYSVIGSVLESSSNEKALVIWGSGFISSKGKLHNEPQQICAVRGPLTRERIIESGFDCPNIFGDPALLYPLFYRPRIQKKYKLGIIPHYVDQRCPSLKMFSNNPDVLMIDILGGINQVVDKICSCEYIASSSLHGIIASDAYRVPSIWIRLSDSVAGGGFKFRDYFQAVNRNDDEPMLIEKDISVQDILGSINSSTISIDLNKLIGVCPFKREDFCYTTLIKKVHPLYKEI